MEAYHEHFALDDVPDQEWLRLAGRKGWVALSHNKAIRYELDELMRHGVRAFFIVGKGPHAAFAEVVLKCKAKILRLLRKSPGPFVARIYQSRAEVGLWVTYSEWIQSKRSRGLVP